MIFIYKIQKMKKIIYLTESDLYKITKRVIVEEKLKEGIFDGISNVFQGLKGVWRGEGYDFFRFLNQLKNIVGDLKKHKTAIQKLEKLKDKVQNSKMPPDKKGELVNEIDRLINAFDLYTTQLEKSERHILDRLAGRSSANMDNTLDKGKDKRRSGVIIDPLEKDKRRSGVIINPLEKDKFEHLSKNEKEELEKYGYYDDEDYEEIYSYPSINQSIKNKVKVTIGGKEYKIPDKNKEKFDKETITTTTTKSPNSSPSNTPSKNDSDSSAKASKTDSGSSPSKSNQTVKENRFRYRYR